MENIKEELIKKIEDMKTTDSDTSKMSTIGASYYDEALDDVIELVKNHGISHHVGDSDCPHPSTTYINSKWKFFCVECGQTGIEGK